MKKTAGENKQKNILKNWIYLTMDKRTRMFLGWKHYSEKCKDAEKFQNLLNLANNLQDVINSNINPLMNEPPTGVDKREEIMKMLLRNCMSRLREAFLKWKNVAKIMEIEDKMANKEKTFMIEKLERFAMQQDKFALAEVLRLFRLNAKKSENVKRLHKMLLNTKIGKALELFKKWKNLPEKPKDDMLGRAANDLERKLAHHAKKALKSGFDPLKDEKNAGENKQKNILKNWIYLTMDKRTRMFLGWKHYSEKCKDAEKFQNIFNLANNLQDVINSNVNPLMNEPPTGEDKRKKIMKMMLRNCHARLREAFLHWKNASIILNLQDTLSNDKKKFMIDKLNNFAIQKINFALSEILRLFLANSKKQDKKKDKEKELMHLERTLNKRVKRELRSGFKPIAKTEEKGKQKRLINTINVINGFLLRERDAFSHWRIAVSNAKAIEQNIVKYKNINSFIQNVTYAMKTNTEKIVNYDKEAEELKMRAFNKMILNIFNRLKEALWKWKNR